MNGHGSGSCASNSTWLKMRRGRADHQGGGQVEQVPLDVGVLLAGVGRQRQHQAGAAGAARPAAGDVALTGGPGCAGWAALVAAAAARSAVATGWCWYCRTRYVTGPGRRGPLEHVVVVVGLQCRRRCCGPARSCRRSSARPGRSSRGAMYWANSRGPAPVAPGGHRSVCRCSDRTAGRCCGWWTSAATDCPNGGSTRRPAGPPPAGGRGVVGQRAEDRDEAGRVGPVGGQRQGLAGAEGHGKASATAQAARRWPWSTRWAPRRSADPPRSPRPWRRTRPPCTTWLFRASAVRRRACSAGTDNTAAASSQRARLWPSARHGSRR